MDTQEIFIRIAHYDDIFSDFDLRPYSRRSLSVDFLEEIRRASQDKRYDGIELVIHVPAERRSEAHEVVIKERLASHFHKHLAMMKAEKRRVLKIGVIMVVLGIACMIAATLVMFNDSVRSLFRSFLVVFLEPAAWFLLWEGMDMIVFHSKEVTPELDFYRKMDRTRGHVHFKSHDPQAQPLA